MKTILPDQTVVLVWRRSQLFPEWSDLWCRCYSNNIASCGSNVADTKNNRYCNIIACKSVLMRPAV